MSSYTDLADQVIAQGTLRIESNVTISSLRRGLQKALDEINISRDIMEQPTYNGRFAIKELELPNTVEITYTTEAPARNGAFAPKLQFKILEDTDDGATTSES